MSKQESQAQLELEKNHRAPLMRIATAGSVDNGKSTLLGRLLIETNSLYDDHRKIVEEQQHTPSTSALALANITDGLRAEREQGITIDVAYRPFATRHRRFLLADSPGHEQYTRNMATGASTADLTIIVVDATQGITAGTKRHAFISALLGVPRFVVVINKMDLVDFSEQRFSELREEFLSFAQRLEVQSIEVIPMSALGGDNLVELSPRTSWYKGQSLVDYLSHVFFEGDDNFIDVRMPIQYVLRGDAGSRRYAGTLRSGILHTNDQVVCLPNEERIAVTALYGPGGTQIDTAYPGDAIAVELAKDIDVSRGSLLVRADNRPDQCNQFEVMCVWMRETPLKSGEELLLSHGTQVVKVTVEMIRYEVDVETLDHQACNELPFNGIGRVSISSNTPLPLDTYRANRAMGSAILIDKDSFTTAAACMVIDRLPAPQLPGGLKITPKQGANPNHLHAEPTSIDRELRRQRAGGPAVTYWFTGLSGAGKTTLARAFEHHLFVEESIMVKHLDGDNLRFGLNKDLGFSKEDRQENIRRIAEVARLFNEAGLTVLCSFISPFNSDRAAARQVIGEDRFVEVHVSTPLNVCSDRDPHGLYAKATRGEIKEFTGISSPYEAPEQPALSIDTSTQSLKDSLHALVAHLKSL